MGISHLSLDLRLGNQRRHRVHDDDIHCPGTNHGLGDLQSLLPVIRLGNVQVVDVDADLLGVDRIQGMLGIDKSGDASPLLHLGYHVERHGGLTAGFRAVDLNDTPLGNPAKPQSDVKAQGACGDSLNIHIRSGIPQLHHRTLAVRLLDLCYGALQRLQLFFSVHIRPFPSQNSNKCSFFIIIIYLQANVNHISHIFRRYVCHCSRGIFLPGCAGQKLGCPPDEENRPHPAVRNP